MPILFGFFLGSAFGRVAFLRLALLMALWVAIPLLAGRVIAANVSVAAGNMAVVAAPVAVLAWALVRPTRSRIKLTLLDGLFAWCRILAIVCAGRLVFKLIEGELRISSLTNEAATIAVMFAAMAVSIALESWVARDRRNEELSR